MIRIRQMRLAQYVAVLLLVVMYVIPAASLAKSAPKSVQPAVKTIIIFPFEDTTKAPVEGLAFGLQRTIQESLSASGAFRAFAFNEQLPSVQRAVLETSLKKDDLKGPYGIEKEQIDSALKVARETAADLMVVGTIDEATADTAKHAGRVTLTTMVVDVRTGEPRTVAVSGNAPANSTASTESELIAQATGDSVGKFVTVVAPVQEQHPVRAVEVKKKRNSSRTIVLGLLLGLTVGLVASRNNSDSSTSAVDNPPPGPF